MKLKKSRILTIHGQLEQIENEAKNLVRKYEKRLKKIHPSNKARSLHITIFS